MKLNECIFCDKKEISQGLLDETSNFYLRANMFPSSPGHVMIISKNHFSCFGDMQKNLDNEYLNLLEQSKERIAKYFSETIVTEQGIHGQSIKHAHTHIFPSVSEIYDFSEKRIIDFVPNEIPVSRQEGLEDIKEIFRQEGQYVSIEEKGDLYVCHTQDYSGHFRPSRDSVVEASGLVHLLNWKTMSDEQKEKIQEWVKETVQKLGKK